LLIHNEKLDDQALHCESAKEHVVATGHVPHGIANE